MENTLPFDPLRKPVLDKPGKRKPLSKFQYAMKFLEQQGLCFSCQTKLVNGSVVDEHIVPRESLPAGICDALENRKLFCRPCATSKTVGDAGVIAKGRRLRGERGSQKARRAKSGPTFKASRAIQGNPKLQGRGFDKSLRKLMNGKVVGR